MDKSSKFGWINNSKRWEKSRIIIPSQKVKRNYRKRMLHWTKISKISLRMFTNRKTYGSANLLKTRKTKNKYKAPWYLKFRHRKRKFLTQFSILLVTETQKLKSKKSKREKRGKSSKCNKRHLWIQASHQFS